MNECGLLQRTNGFTLNATVIKTNLLRLFWSYLVILRYSSWKLTHMYMPLN